MRKRNHTESKYVLSRGVTRSVCTACVYLSRLMLFKSPPSPTRRRGASRPMRGARRRGAAVATATAAAAASLLPWAAAGGTLLPWRADGRCGTEVFAPDGSRPARCNPWHPDGSTCCSAAGWCGRSKDHCLCPKCVNYQIREPWRKDGRCGDEVEGKDGTKPAQCNPLDALNRTCCSDVGWCGGSKEHRLCRYFLDAPFPWTFTVA